MLQAGTFRNVTCPWHCAGLDSTTAMHCVEILRELAAGGRSIITTIHQPSSRLYQSLDKLLLLSQVRSFGEAAFSNVLCLRVQLLRIGTAYSLMPQPKSAWA